MLQLKKFPDLPVSTREKARESRRHPEEPRFRLLAREEVSFPCVFGKEFQGFQSHLKRRRSHRKGERKTRVVPHSQSPQMLQSIPGKPVFPALLDFQAEDRLTPRCHVGQPCGKASWESFEGKPRGKTRNPLINPTGKLTLLLMLRRKAHVHAPIGDEDDSPVETPVVPQDPFQHWRGNLRFGHRFQKRS